MNYPSEVARSHEDSCNDKWRKEMNRKFNFKTTGIDIDLVALMKTSQQMCGELLDIAVVVAEIVIRVSQVRKKIGAFMES